MLWGGYGVIIRPFVNFAVGMFIFLSGYLTKENENGVYRDIIYRRIKKIIIPYIIWSFIFAVVNRRINTFIPDVFMSKCNGIYLCHMLIIRILNKLVPMANVFPINAIFVIMISTVCVMMAHRILGKYAYVIGV